MLKNHHRKRVEQRKVPLTRLRWEVLAAPTAEGGRTEFISPSATDSHTLRGRSGGLFCGTSLM